MSHPQLQIFFIQLSLLLATALSCGLLMKKMGQAPVLGELLGGILLGPTFFGAIQPDLFFKLFPANSLVNTSIDALNRIGMLFFMFAAGLEINILHFRNDKCLVACTSLFGGIIPFGLGFGMVLLFPALWHQPDRLMLLALFIGTALSISALPVIARILIDLGLINSRIGMTIISSAMVNDVIGWALFTFLLSKLGNPEFSENAFIGLGRLVIFAIFILAIGRWLIQPLLRRFQLWQDWPGGILVLVSAFTLFAAGCAEMLGIHAIFAAFMVGIALGHSEELQTVAEKKIYAIVELFALNFFAPLYFVSIGLKVNFLDHFDWVLALSLTTVACLTKILGAGMGARIGGLKWDEAIAVGVGLNARGAIGLILASVALDHKLIDQRVFVALIFMALMTTLISGFILPLRIRTTK